MSIRALDAANAYSQSLGRALGTGGDSPISDGAASAVSGGGSFGDLLGKIYTDASEATHASEVSAARSLAGKADLVDVVSAVNNAEVAVETLVTVRDRVISAYQDIMRMPI